MKNLLKPLAKSALISLGLTVVASAIDADIQKETFGCGMATLVISKAEMNDIIKIAKCLRESNLLMKDLPK